MSGTGTGSEDIGFRWGKMKGVGKDKGTQFYESFVYGDVEYFLYDVVFLYQDGVPEPFVGKLIKIWELRQEKKRIKIHWFFRPGEIRSYLEDGEYFKNELFLATGKGTGLYNINSLEVLAGKCNVVCTSKDQRNPQPSPEDLKVADFIFYRTFNVDNFSISENIEDKIDGIEVKYFFNGNELKPSVVTKAKVIGSTENIIKGKGNHTLEVILEDRPLKKMRMVEENVKLNSDADKVSPSANKRLLNEMGRVKISDDFTVIDKNSENLRLHKKDAMVLDRSLKMKLPESSVVAEKKADNHSMKVTKRPETDKSKWFADVSWDKRIEMAYEQDRLVMLDNLNPDYSQSEVEDIISRAFTETCSVRLIEESTFTKSIHGKALVIFKTSDAANNVVQRLDREILMLPGGRPLLAMKGIKRPPSKKSSRLIGLLPIDKYAKIKRMRDGLRKAASASHLSQPNTIEYEMALKWMYLEKRSNLWWEMLLKTNVQEVEEHTKRLKHK
ncbi:hypothetical protein ZOSMA_75G00570 [Zostera marina]|uniref:BAH domain-containing protein n=1 Tax=Zostera marina TaxID=29655 RepID=A0A0K9NPD8_ZOSMR|nr:hypothetical protein ZOSMA_75G00570 [Zostera marina]